MRLFGWFRPSPDLSDTLQAVADRVDALERTQLGHELEWRETRDKLLRYLKRVQEIERRETPATNGPRGASRALLAAKFGRGDHNHGGE